MVKYIRNCFSYFSTITTTDIASLVVDNYIDNISPEMGLARVGSC